MRVTIDIPPNLCEAVSETFDDDAVARWAVETLVVEGVRECILSIGEAGEFLGLG